MPFGLGQWSRLLLDCLLSWLFLVGLAGLARRATHLFFASPKKSKQKKGDPQSGSLRFASGNLCCPGKTGVRANSPTAQTARGPDPVFPGHHRPSQNGWGKRFVFLLPGGEGAIRIPIPHSLHPFCLRRGAARYWCCRTGCATAGRWSLHWRAEKSRIHGLNAPENIAICASRHCATGLFECFLVASGGFEVRLATRR